MLPCPLLLVHVSPSLGLRDWLLGEQAEQEGISEEDREKGDENPIMSLFARHRIVGTWGGR